jgi:hypothetical protein
LSVKSSYYIRLLHFQKQQTGRHSHDHVLTSTRLNTYSYDSCILVQMQEIDRAFCQEEEREKKKIRERKER